MPLKTLKPSMRESKRYLLVEGKNLEANVERAILDFIGVLGMSKAGLSFVKGGKNSDSAVISVNRESLDSVRASLAVFPEEISVKKVSGTLRGLRKK
jgi:RNase P/RNase MRP subunit POP5